MISVHDLLRALIFFVTPFFCSILSFLRHSWGCSSDPKIDIEQGTGAANTTQTPGISSIEFAAMSFTNLIPDQSNSDIIIKGTPGTEKPCPPSTTATRCTFAKVLKRCLTRLVPKTRHPSTSRGRLDSSMLVDGEFSKPSMISPGATDPTIHDHDSEPVPGATTRKSEKAVLAVEALAADAIPNPGHVLIQAKKDHDCHCCELNAKDTPGETKENGCEADISGEWHGFVGYDNEDTYQDDFEYPEHRELKLAIEHLLLHRVPNTITEATEEGGGNEEEVGEGGAPSQVQAAQASRAVPPLPIIGRFSSFAFPCT